MICFYASINSKMYSMLLFLCLDRWQFKRIFLIRLCVFFFYWFWTYMIYRLTRFIFFHIARMIFCLVFCYSIAYNWATSKKMMAPKAWPTEKKSKKYFIHSKGRIPVDPNPLSPLTLALFNSFTSFISSLLSYDWMISWATLSPFLILKSTFDSFVIHSFISDW